MCQQQPLTFQKMEFLQETGYNKGITEIQQESTEYHLRAADIQRMRPGTNITNCNLFARGTKRQEWFTLHPETIQVSSIIEQLWPQKH